MLSIRVNANSLQKKYLWSARQIFRAGLCTHWQKYMRRTPPCLARKHGRSETAPARIRLSHRAAIASPTAQRITAYCLLITDHSPLSPDPWPLSPRLSNNSGHNAQAGRATCTRCKSPPPPAVPFARLLQAPSASRPVWPISKVTGPYRRLAA